MIESQDRRSSDKRTTKLSHVQSMERGPRQLALSSFQCSMQQDTVQQRPAGTSVRWVACNEATIARRSTHEPLTCTCTTPCPCPLASADLLLSVPAIEIKQDVIFPYSSASSVPASSQFPSSSKV